MATNLRKVDEREYTTETDVGVLYSEAGLRSPRSITADMQFFQTDKGNNTIIPPGCVWKEVGGLGRVLPMSKAIAATTTSSKILSVKLANIFKVGEVLTVGATVIGTIASIDPWANTITLAANAAAAVAIDDILQVQGTTYDDILGINISTLNLTERGNDVACYTSASVYAARMPIWNATIAGKLPEITTV
jgi:hypothetical protein